MGLWGILDVLTFGNLVTFHLFDQLAIYVVQFPYNSFQNLALPILWTVRVDACFIDNMITLLSKGVSVGDTMGSFVVVRDYGRFFTALINSLNNMLYICLPACLVSPALVYRIIGG